MILPDSNIRMTTGIIKTVTSAMPFFKKFKAIFGFLSAYAYVMSIYTPNPNPAKRNSMKQFDHTIPIPYPPRT